MAISAELKQLQDLLNSVPDSAYDNADKGIFPDLAGGFSGFDQLKGGLDLPDPVKNIKPTDAAKIVAAAATGNPLLAASAVTSGTKGATTSMSFSDQVASYFVRGTVIILGFIFVAIGLSMFKVPVVTDFVQGVKQGAKEGLAGQ